MGLLNFPELLTIDLVNSFVRDKKEDILYNPHNPETKNIDYCLFYYIDRNGNNVFAYNRHLITADTLTMYKYKSIYGCLTLFSNDDKYFIDPRYCKEEKIIEQELTSKAWYKSTSTIYIKA